jgi:hypothetical protein
LGELRPYLLTISQHFTKHASKPHLSRNNVSKNSVRLKLLSSSLASILLAFPIHATTTTDLENSKLSTAINLLDSVATCIESGPATQNYRTLVRSNVEKIKADLLDAQTEVTEIASNRDLYKNFANTAFPDFFIFIPSMTTFLSDYTSLVLINKISISADQKANLGNYTNMIIVGNYTPTDLDYEKLTALQSLRMYDGGMTTTLQRAIQTLSKTSKKLRYLEVPRWGTSIEAYAFGDEALDNVSSIQQLVGFEDVTTVNNGAFYFCADLKSLDLPNLEIAGYRAFFYCTGLTSLDLPKLKSAGDGVFWGCAGLKSLSLSELKSAGSCAFLNCSGLTSLYLPKLESAGIDAFMGVPKALKPAGF